MTEQDKKLVELADKVKDLDTTIRNLHFRMKRTRKNLKLCRETCKETNDLIEEINARNQHK